MAQVSTGLRAVLASPVVYDFLQDLMGAKTGRRGLVREIIRPKVGDRVLDIGCGTARILDFLPEVEYHGFDMSQRYIDHAIGHYGRKASFTCAMLDRTEVDNLKSFDLVLAMGLLHHLDDAQVAALMRLARSALGEGGRLVTIDPCYAQGQSRSARYLVSRDRGQNIRTPDAYRGLADSVFSDVVGTTRHRAWIPYSHFIMECKR